MCIIFIGCVFLGIFLSIVFSVLGKLCSDFSFVLYLVSLDFVGNLLCDSKKDIFLNCVLFVNLLIL